MATRLKKVAAPSSKRKVRNPLLPHPSTKPLSSAASSKEDQRSTNELQDYLKSLKAYESSTRSQFRETAFQILEFILKKWTTEVVNLKKQGKLLPPDTPSKVDFRVLTFGSFALGVHDPTSDIDVVVVVPQFIDYEDFFYVLPKKLREDNAVSEVTIIADAFVPVIKFKIGSCDIDLLLARLSVNTLPENDDDFLDDKYVMQSVTDHRSVKSINGYRVARAILELVSDEHTFHTTLRFVKCWAKARGIYSNVLGYLGGISWAILTMFVCQYYPNHSPSTLIVKFFQFYSAVWDWRDAVRLTSVVEYPDQPANFPAKTWNPKTNTRDQGHIMSVITPAWPASNSTYNVSQSTLEVMRREFSRGHSVLSQYLDKNGIPRNKADVSAQAVWKTVLTKIDFFQLYRNYLRIDICAENASDFRKWKGYVEAKLRSLIQYLEGLTHLAKVHPLPEFFDVPNTNRVQKSCFFGLDFTYPTIGKTVVDMREPIDIWLDILYQWPSLKQGMLAIVVRDRRSELPSYLNLRKQKSTGAPSLARTNGAKGGKTTATSNSTSISSTTTASNNNDKNNTTTTTTAMPKTKRNLRSEITSPVLVEANGVAKKRRRR